MQVKRTIPSLPHLFRNVRRWTEILSVLSKYGLADWLSRVNVEFVKNRLKSPDGAVLARLSQPERIRLAMASLGPTFIKFGQMLSTRPDLVGVRLASELTRLQADVRADDFETVKGVIEEEQGRLLEEIFLTFEEKPLASASIGQVHLARLKDGTDVIVKVRHVNIERSVETDLEILAGLAQLAERIDEFRPYQPKALVAEMARTMPRELDFRLEVRNLSQFYKRFEKSKTVKVPKVYPELCSEKMLTMERLEGYKPSHLASPTEVSLELESNGEIEKPSSRASTVEMELPNDVDLSEVAKNGAELYLQMIFDHGQYHADPHPGNMMILPDGRIGLMDFGMVGRISEHLREDIESMLVSIVNSDVPILVTLVKRVGSCPLDMDEDALANDLADFVGHFATQSMAHFDMSGALNEFVTIVRKYHITLPGEAAMLIKVLIQLEGTGRLLDPQFSLMEIMKPFHRKLIMRRLSPARQARKMRRFYMQIEQLADTVPQTLTSVLDQIKRGKFDVHLDHRRLGPSVNRLVLGLMTSALFLGSSMMLSSKVPPLLFPGKAWMGIQDLSMLGLAGCIASVFLGFRLFMAIRRSGNLDQQDPR